MTAIQSVPLNLIDPSPLNPRKGDEARGGDVVITLLIPARYAAELERLAADVETTDGDWARSALLEAIDPHNHLREYQHTAEEDA